MPPLEKAGGLGGGGGGRRRGGARGARPGRRRPGRFAHVVAFLPTEAPEASARYAAELAERHDRMRVWDARAFVVVAPELERALDDALGGMRHALEVVADPEGAVRGRWGVEDGVAALFIADRWGQIYHAETGGAVDDLSRGDEIEEWLKYLATQCAECGVPDEPGHGEWSID